MFSWFYSHDSFAVNQKQRLLGTTENAMMYGSQRYHGHTKICEILHLEGPYISLEALTVAVNHLQRRHPILRSRLQIHNEANNSYLLEEDDTLQLKIREMPRKRADHMNFWLQEWREREADVTVIGQGLAEFWLLQDPEDKNDDNSPREIVVICEHSVSDGLSLSTVAHELLIALSGENNSLFANSLDWPMTMEAAIKRSLSMIGKIATVGRLIFSLLYLRLTNTYTTAKISTPAVDFPLSEMDNFCHTETCYTILKKEDTQKLIDRCHSEGVTITSAISSAILCVISTLIKSEDNQTSAVRFCVGADTRRRCVPPIPNHDLSYHVSGITPFVIPTGDLPKNSEDIWKFSKILGQRIKASIDAGEIHAFGMIMGKIQKRVLDTPDGEVPTCGISSWGVLPFYEQYGRWKLIGMTPIVNLKRAIMPFITAQTVNGVLTIMFVGANPVIPITLLESLRDGTTQKLQQMIED